MADALLAYVGQSAAYVLFAPEIRAGDESSWAREYRMVDPARFPGIARLGTELAQVSAEAVFDVRVEALIAAIEARAASPSEDATRT